MSVNKYQNGKIYKITDNGYTKCYYGSTTSSLSARIAQHILRYKKKTEENSSVFKLFDEFGFENCQIVLEELYPCNSRKELTQREGQFIKNNDCVNERIAGRTREQWNEINGNEYYKNNRESVLQKRKEYASKNKEAIAQRQKEYRTKNKEAIKLSKKLYYENNKSNII